MIREQVDSNSIISIGYDKNSQILDIKFKNKCFCQHFKVLEEEYKNFMSDTYYSSYFYRKIRDSYKQKKPMSN